MYFSDKKSVKGYYWKIRDYDKNLALTIYQKNNISELVSRLLAIKKIKYADVSNYLEPKLKNLLKDPFHLIDMDKAVKVIYETIQNDEKICIFGDYDVDGATATALMVKFFRSIGINVDSYVPDRIEEGYGLNDNSIDILKKNNVKLIITVDCGISCKESVEYAKKNGINIVITDHHLGPSDLPEAKAIVNPNRFDENSDYKYLAGVGVAFMLAIALNTYLREKDFYKERKIEEPNLLYLLDLVALGTVCDVMPLIGINRAFVKQGLLIFSKRKNVGLATLSDLMDIEEINDTYHLGYILGPRINACGRVGDVSIGNKLLSCEDPIEAKFLAEKLNKFNYERQVIEKEILDKAIEKIEKENLNENSFLFIEGENWHEGVIGIIASRLKDRYNKPVFVISKNGNEGKASCRSVDPSVDIGSVIISAKEKNLLITGGGHAMAGGFTFDLEKTQQIKDFIESRIQNNLSIYLDKDEKDCDLILDCNDITLQLVNSLESIGPYGSGNHKPKIILKDILIMNTKLFGKNNEHIRSVIVSNSCNKTNTVTVNAFRIGKNDEIYKVLNSKKPCSLLGTLSLNRWMGLDNIQFILEDIIL